MPISRYDCCMKFACQKLRRKELTLELHEAVLILWFTEIIHQCLGLVLAQLLSQVAKKLPQIVALHCVVIVLVVQLQDLNIVVEASLGFILGLFELGPECLQTDGGRSLFLSASNLPNAFEGGVQVTSTEDIPNIEGIDGAISLEVIDIKGKVHG